jgi:hypothetical protein
VAPPLSVTAIRELGILKHLFDQPREISLGFL